MCGWSDVWPRTSLNIVNAVQSIAELTNLLGEVSVAAA